MRRFYIEIEDDAFDAIADLAQIERRPSRDQAAVLLEAATKRAIQRRKPSFEQDPEWSGSGRQFPVVQPA